MVVVYKWGGIAFDDKALIKTLVLPSNADNSPPVTFHDEAGNNYQVPAGKVFITGRLNYKEHDANTGTIGESGTADGTLTKNLIVLPGDGAWHYIELIAIFVAGKYVTGVSSSANLYLYKDTTLYGVEIDA